MLTMHKPVFLSSIEDEEARTQLPLLQARYHALKQEIDTLTAEKDEVYASFRALADRIPAKKIKGVCTRVEMMRGTIKPEWLMERAGLTPDDIELCTEYKDVSYYRIAPPERSEAQ